MNKFINLICLEVNRIAKMFFIALATYLVLGYAWAIYTSKSFMNRINIQAVAEHMTLEQYIKGNQEYFSVDYEIFQNKFLIMGAVFLVLLVGIYSFVIWYRDWYGSNKTVYSLLVLPINRVKIFWSKAITIIIMVLSVLSTFIIGILGTFYIGKSILDKALTNNTTLLQVFTELFDSQLSFKMDILLVLICGVLLVFLFVLLERSFKVKGIISAIVIAIAYLALNLAVLSIEYFYILEKIYIIATIQIVFAVGAIIYSNYLIKNKVAV